MLRGVGSIELFFMWTLVVASVLGRYLATSLLALPLIHAMM